MVGTAIGDCAAAGAAMGVVVGVSTVVGAAMGVGADTAGGNAGTSPVKYSHVFGQSAATKHSQTNGI